MEKIKINIRDMKEYDECIDEIGQILTEHKLSFVEAYGVLECVKSELTIQQYELDNEDEDD